MQPYKFLKDWTGGTYVAPGLGIATQQVSYKKDEIISNGKFVQEQIVSGEPVGYVEFVDPTKGTIRVPIGGKGSVLKAYTYGAGGLAGDNRNVIDSPKNTVTQTASKFTLKNVLIGVAVVGGIFGLLKWTKII